MITLNDIESVQINSRCFRCSARLACEHGAIVTLKDGRRTSVRDAYHICAIITNLAHEKLNPEGAWNAEEAKKHFKVYERWGDCAGMCTADSAEDVLKKIFAKITLEDIEHIVIEVEASCCPADPCMHHRS